MGCKEVVCRCCAALWPFGELSLGLSGTARTGEYRAEKEREGVGREKEKERERGSETSHIQQTATLTGLSTEQS